MTPRYKLEMAKEHLASLPPDLIVVQDAVDVSDMSSILTTITPGSYDWCFRPDHSVMKESNLIQARKIKIPSDFLKVPKALEGMVLSLLKYAL